MHFASHSTMCVHMYIVILRESFPQASVGMRANIRIEDRRIAIAYMQCSKIIQNPLIIDLSLAKNKASIVSKS